VRKSDPLLDPNHALLPHYLPDTVGSVLFGLALLLMGRRLFWLFVAGLGFVIATEIIVPHAAPDNPPLALAICLIAGVAGALIAMFLQKVAIGLAGAVTGAYYGSVVLKNLPIHDPATVWIALLGGAILGALVLLFLFKWALIVFSSIVGAHLLVRAFQQELPAGVTMTIFTALVIVGIVFQGKSLSRPTAD